METLIITANYLSIRGTFGVRDDVNLTSLIWDYIEGILIGLPDGVGLSSEGQTPLVMAMVVTWLEDEEMKLMVEMQIPKKHPSQTHLGDKFDFKSVLGSWYLLDSIKTS